VAGWDCAMAINVRSAYVVARWIAERGKPCDLVLVGGLDRAQSLPLPVHFAASQGALTALVMALGHELGPRGVRVNLVALGPLTAGISTQLAARRRKDFETFSALRRAGTPDEAAKAITWLALENTFIQGKVIPVNGGI
jgi:3-oxoacyl-[acyl-carrier protein] reductase